MTVEMEKPAVSFTDEAQAAVQRSILRLERRIRARAADQAIKARGTPAEVTGSDIEKAYRELIGSSGRDLSVQSLQTDRRHWQRLTWLRLVSVIYTWAGFFIALVGGIYPFIRSQLLNPSVKLSVTLAGSGLVVAGLGLTMRAYLKYREAIRRDEKGRIYRRGNDYQEELD
jgi:hypothetical protein